MPDFTDRLPTTPEEVAEAEALLEANPVQLPESLKDPMAVLVRGLERRNETLCRLLSGIINCFYEFGDQPGCPGLSEHIDGAHRYLEGLQSLPKSPWDELT